MSCQPVFLLSSDIKILQIIEGKVYINDQHITKVKFVGTLIAINPKHIQLLDPFGVVEIFKNSDTQLKNKIYALVCNVFARDNKVFFYLIDNTQLDLKTKILMIQKHLEDKKGKLERDM